jgi:hypothetical protein
MGLARMRPIREMHVVHLVHFMHIFFNSYYSEISRNGTDSEKSTVVRGKSSACLAERVRNRVSISCILPIRN